MITKTPNLGKPHGYLSHCYSPGVLIPWQVGHESWASIKTKPSSFTQCPANCLPQPLPPLVLPHPWSLFPMRKHISWAQPSVKGVPFVSGDLLSELLPTQEQTTPTQCICSLRVPLCRWWISQGSWCPPVQSWDVENEAGERGNELEGRGSQRGRAGERGRGEARGSGHARQDQAAPGTRLSPGWR